MIKIGQSYVLVYERPTRAASSERQTPMHRRSPRLLGYALMACVPTLGLALAFGPAAGASTEGRFSSSRNKLGPK